ncbi:uncharacterized protein N7500_001717 [Penicillium coprophilum]|uniref:uncharacterized protein n=1 Tax=Penicillium coprophilum TaxID=36646 RepID=UPI0023978E7A|nr:uncharacterized protein N7500_001717 [Penicillium coprophilum]KAJ5173786.1 hypothetical protein N7500_001717 [Penicillium coprophilum]
MHAWQTILAAALGCQLANAAEWRIQAAPIITGALLPRQEQTCPEATETLCSDGTGGCCPSGSPCTYISGKPRCGGGCDIGGPTCLGGGCCDAGYLCPTLGGSFCHKATNFLPAPTASLTITSSIDSGPTETTEARITDTKSEPTSTSDFSSTSVPSRTPQPSSSSKPTTAITSDTSSASPSYSPGGDTSDDASDSSESSGSSGSSESSDSSSTTESSTADDNPGAASPETAPGMAGSLSVSWDSWMALAVMVPFIL